MKANRKSVVLAFVFGFVCSGLVTHVWHRVRNADCAVHDDVVNGSLKIKLARRLRPDEDASRQFGNLVSACKLISGNIEGMEEGIREDAWTVYEELYKKTFLEIAVRLAQFAGEHPDTTAALTAKLLYTEVVPPMTGSGAMTEEAERRSANCTLFFEQIVNRHPKTWQATAAWGDLIRERAGSEEEYIRLTLEQLDKGIVEPNESDPDFDSYCQWFNESRFPLRAAALCSVAHQQEKLGTAKGKIDPRWLKEAKKTYEQLLEEYPDYSRGLWFKSSLSDIDEILASCEAKGEIREKY